MKATRDTSEMLVIPKGYRLLTNNDTINKFDKCLAENDVWLPAPRWICGRTPNGYPVIRINPLPVA